jgi:RND family efflux transporter MFP subunit
VTDSQRAAIATGVAAFLLAVTGCGSEQTTATPKPGPRAEAPQTITITAAPVESRTVQRSVETSGSLLAWEEVALNTAVSGTVAHLLVDLGDRVEAGQVVAELDTREFVLAVEQAEAALQAARSQVERARAQVAGAEANLRQVRESIKAWEANDNRARAALEEARTNLERNRQLLQRELIAAREFDAARTQYETMLAQYQTSQVERTQYPDRVRVAEAQRESDRSALQAALSEVKQREAGLGIAQKKLADATLRASIGGAIAKRHINPGEFVKENTPVFTIVRSHPLKYSGTVPERSALELKTGQQIRLQVDPVPGRAFEGRITRVSPAVDVSNRTAALEALVPNAQGLLKPGLFARGVVQTREDTGVPFVPEAAVSYFVGITKVFVIADGKAQERAVKVGGKQDGAVEILEGVKPGQRVATSSLAQLYDGAPVRVAGREAK